MKLSAFLSVFLIFYSLTFSTEMQLTKPPLSEEQKRINRERTKAFLKNDKSRLDAESSSNDSIIDLLRYKDQASDSCIDRDCYIQKKDFNYLLNHCTIKSQNIDSVRTILLFELLKSVYLKKESKELIIKKDVRKDSCNNRSGVSAYKLRIIASTDSLKLAEILKSFSNKVSMFCRPLEVVYHNIKGDDAIAASMYFGQKKGYLDFIINKDALDSVTVNQWNSPTKSDFGFYSFCVIEKDTCKSEYNDFVLNLKYYRSHLKKNPETVDEINNFVFNNEDTLMIRFWSKPAVLSESGKMDEVDTAKLAYFKITDKQLPDKIRKFVREQYFKNGTVFFNNYRTDYCIWSLKIDKVAKCEKSNTKGLSENYLIAKNLLFLSEMEAEKQNQKLEVEKVNLYISRLAEKNRSKISSIKDTLTAVTQLFKITNQQIQKSALEWVKNNIVFKDDVFKYNYLPKEITGNNN